MSEGERVRKREGGRERVRKREREGEKWNMYSNCPELLFLFLKGMAGTLAPFSYLVLNNS